MGVRAGMLGMKGIVSPVVGCCAFFYEHHLPFLVAAAFSVRMWPPHANAQQGSKGTGRSAQASQEGICWEENSMSC